MSFYFIFLTKHFRCGKILCMERHQKLLKMILSGLFLALAYVMPFLTGQIPSVGSMLCPMHIPVILCGFICGWQYGLLIGIFAPLLRSLTLGMPPIFPTAVAMAFELATYGAISGLMYKILPKKKPFIYVALLIAMIVGRLVWGLAMFACMSVSGNEYTFAAFIAGAVTNAIPGIIVQFLLIPVLVMVIDNPKVSNLVHESKHKSDEACASEEQ